MPTSQRRILLRQKYLSVGFLQSRRGLLSSIDSACFAYSDFGYVFTSVAKSIKATSKMTFVEGFVAREKSTASGGPFRLAQSLPLRRPFSEMQPYALVAAPSLGIFLSADGFLSFHTAAGLDVRLLKPDGRAQHRIATTFCM